MPRPRRFAIHRARTSGPGGLATLLHDGNGVPSGSQSPSRAQPRFYALRDVRWRALLEDRAAPWIAMCWPQPSCRPASASTDRRHLLPVLRHRPIAGRPAARIARKTPEQLAEVARMAVLLDGVKPHGNDHRHAQSWWTAAHPSCATAPIRRESRHRPARSRCQCEPPRDPCLVSALACRRRRHRHAGDAP